MFSQPCGSKVPTRRKKLVAAATSFSLAAELSLGRLFIML